MRTRHIAIVAGIMLAVSTACSDASSAAKVPRGLTGSGCFESVNKLKLDGFSKTRLTYAKGSPDPASGICRVDSVRVSDGNATVVGTIQTTTTTLPPTTTVPPPPWYPAGYTPRDDTIAWRWLPSGSFKCDSYSSCWGIEVVSHYGCSNVYAEVSVSDANGTAVDYANDVLGGLSAGQHGVLKPSFVSDGGRYTGRLTDLNCT